MPNRDLQLHSRPGRAHSPMVVENVEA